MKLAHDYQLEHPELSESGALDAFSGGSLVAFYNKMADYARSLKPCVRVMCHVHPVFLADLYVGKRLKVNESCTSAAWFCQPYWSKARIVEHVKEIFGREKEYWPFAEGAALVGVPAGPSSMVIKPAEVVELELRTILAAGGDRIHICSTENMLKSHEHVKVFKSVFN